MLLNLRFVVAAVERRRFAVHIELAPLGLLRLCVLLLLLELVLEEL